MMNYKNIIIIAVLALAFGFLAFSVGFYLKQKAASVELPAEVQVTNQTQEPPAAEITYTEEWSTIFMEARRARDAAKCESISDLAARRDCGDKINLGIAYEDKNIDLCRAIFTPALRDDCYTNLGIELNVNYCRYLSSEEFRNLCNAERTAAQS
ncbi:MAG: hypothetical protein PHW53_00495 [Patescibacteria group bacterium]|nr:hypothetical protein [Patescibacteria group bacterium]